jgi:preprotein translocase subunit SecE
MLFATSKLIDPSVSEKKKTLEPKKEEKKARTLLVFVDYIITLIFFFFFDMSKIVFFVEVFIFSKDFTAFVCAIVGCRKR